VTVKGILTAIQTVMVLMQQHLKSILEEIHLVFPARLMTNVKGTSNVMVMWMVPMQPNSR